MSVDLARKIAAALDVRSESKIRVIDETLSAYARLTAPSSTLPVTGTIDASQVASGTFDDARIAESNVTQHEAALTITEIQISDLGNYPEKDVAETVTEEWTFQQGLALDSGEQIKFGSSAMVRAGHVTLDDDATGTFAVPHYAIVAVVTSWGNDANVVFVAEGASAVASIFSGSLVSLAAAANPDVDGDANYWKSSTTELSIKNRLGSARTFNLFVLAQQ